MRRLAMSGAMVAGSTSSVQRRYAGKAREWQSSKDAILNEVHSLLHPSASRPEGPAALLVCNADQHPEIRIGQGEHQGGHR